MNTSGFYKISLSLNENLFDELSKTTEFDKINNGRMANHLVRVEKNVVPIVRTTSKYNISAQNFSPIHSLLNDSINIAIRANNLNIPAQFFDNALIEIYDATYTKMNYHSDQNLDLANNSWICLFSCYEDPNNLSEQNIRKLKIKDKTTNQETEISMTHNTIILFSTETNMKFQHKIVLENKQSNVAFTENKWLGITFRTSKTFLDFKNNEPFFLNGETIQLANEEQEKMFFKLRGEENRSLDFTYPFLNFTINPADLLMPK